MNYYHFQSVLAHKMLRSAIDVLFADRHQSGCLSCKLFSSGKVKSIVWQGELLQKLWPNHSSARIELQHAIEQLYSHRLILGWPPCRAVKLMLIDGGLEVVWQPLELVEQHQLIEQLQVLVKIDALTREENMSLLAADNSEIGYVHGTSLWAPRRQVTFQLERSHQHMDLLFAWLKQVKMDQFVIKLKAYWWSEEPQGYYLSGGIIAPLELTVTQVLAAIKDEATNNDYE